jgi:chromatin remodeling complex protein RSC6
MSIINPMVKTKTSTTSSSADSSAAAAAVSAPAVSSSSEGASKLKRLPKPKSVVSAAVESSDSAAPVNVVTSSSDAPASVVDSSSALLSLYSDYSSKLQAAHATWNTLRSEFRLLERQTVRELKNAQKASQKKKRKTGNRAPSGFVKPTLISNELAGFLGKPEGSEMARTEVTREINKYIRTNNLQDKENGRKINPDKKLTSLLKLKKGDELTYFNLQRYMSPHFAKSAALQAAAAAAAAPVASS